MKKLLSIVLALALCLTAFVGCLTVSAAGENTIVVDTANITTGAATTDVKVTITSAGVMALQFAIDYGTLAAPAVAYDEAAVTVTATEDNTGLIVEADANFTSTVITLTFDTAALTAGTYAIAVNDVEAGNYDETLVAFETTAGAIVVADAVVEPECEHANIKYVSHVAPIDGGANGSITYTCKDCGETKTEDVLYDNTFKFDTAYADYQAETVLCFVFATTATNWTGVDQTKSFAILTKDDNSSEDAEPIVKVQTIAELTNNGEKTTNIVMSYPLAAKELNDNVARQMIVYKDGKWYSRKVGNYSFVTYATQGMSRFGETEKTLIIDLLNYGTIAQTRFTYNVDNPANATFGAYSGSTNEITVENKLTTSNKKDRYRFNSIAAAFESRAELNFLVTDINKNAITDLNAVYVEVEYVDATGAPQVKTITGDDFRVTSTGNVYADFAELHATQMRQVITATLKASDDDSIQYVATFSIESYAAAMWNDSNDGAIVQALIRFGDSANAHFNG